MRGRRADVGVGVGGGRKKRSSAARLLLVTRRAPPLGCRARSDGGARCSSLLRRRAAARKAAPRPSDGSRGCSRPLKEEREREREGRGRERETGTSLASSISLCTPPDPADKAIGGPRQPNGAPAPDHGLKESGVSLSPPSPAPPRPPCCFLPRRPPIQAVSTRQGGRATRLIGLIRDAVGRSIGARGSQPEGRAPRTREGGR